MTFSTCFQDLKTWPERIAWLHELESIGERYPEYNISFVSEVIVPTDLLSYMHNAMVTSQGQVCSANATRAHAHNSGALGDDRYRVSVYGDYATSVEPVVVHVHLYTVRRYQRYSVRHVVDVELRR